MTLANSYHKTTPLAALDVAKKETTSQYLALLENFGRYNTPLELIFTHLFNMTKDISFNEKKDIAYSYIPRETSISFGKIIAEIKAASIIFDLWKELGIVFADSPIVKFGDDLINFAWADYRFYKKENKLIIVGSLAEKLVINNKVFPAGKKVLIDESGRIQNYH